MTKTQKFDLFKSLLIAIISATSVVLLQQLFHSKNVAEEFLNKKKSIDHELRNEIIKSNHESYISIQNFTHFGEIETIIRYNKTINPDSTCIGYMTIPTFIVDTFTFGLWLNEKNKILENKNKIDSDIFLEFYAIERIVRKNPIPNNCNIEELAKSVWADQRFLKEWHEKNSSLWLNSFKAIDLNANRPVKGIW